MFWVTLKEIEIDETDGRKYVHKKHKILTFCNKYEKHCIRVNYKLKTTVLKW